MSETQVTPTPLLKTVASATVPERIAAVPTPCRRAIVFGYKTLTRGANSGAVFIGPSSVDGEQLVPIDVSGMFILEEVDLYDWYVDVPLAGDGVVVLHW